MLPTSVPQIPAPSTRRRARKRQRALVQLCLTVFSIAALIASFWSLHRMRQVNEASIERYRKQQAQSTTDEKNYTSNTISESMKVSNSDKSIERNSSNDKNKDDISSSKEDKTSDQIKEEEEEKLQLSESHQKQQVTEEIEQRQEEKDQDVHGEDDNELNRQTDVLDEEEGGRKLNIRLPEKSRKNNEDQTDSSEQEKLNLALNQKDDGNVSGVQKEINQDTTVRVQENDDIDNKKSLPNVESMEEADGDNSVSEEEIDQVARKELNSGDNGGVEQNMNESSTGKVIFKNNEDKESERDDAIDRTTRQELDK